MDKIAVEKTNQLVKNEFTAIHETNRPDLLIQEFLDTTLLPQKWRHHIYAESKADLTNRVSLCLFDFLNTCGIPTHYIQMVSKRSMLIQRLNMIPIDVVVRNVAAGRMVDEHHFKEGTRLSSPVIEHYLRNDKQHTTLLNSSHLTALNLVSEEEIEIIKRHSLNINILLQGLFGSIDLDLVDIKLEFGHTKFGEIVLGDEISPSTCRLKVISSNLMLEKKEWKKDKIYFEDEYLGACFKIIEEANRLKELPKPQMPDADKSSAQLSDIKELLGYLNPALSEVNQSIGKISEDMKKMASKFGGVE